MYHACVNVAEQVLLLIYMCEDMPAAAFAINTRQQCDHSIAHISATTPSNTSNFGFGACALIANLNVDAMPYA